MSESFRSEKKHTIKNKNKNKKKNNNNKTRKTKTTSRTFSRMPIFHHQPIVDSVLLHRLRIAKRKKI